MKHNPSCRGGWSLLLGLGLIFTVVTQGADSLGTAPQSPYEQIVAFENEATAAEARKEFTRAVEAHTGALAMVKSLDRPRLTAALFERLGLTLEADNRLQDAVFAYESGLKALAEDSKLDLNQVLRNLTTVSKNPSPSPRSAPADVYSIATDRELAAAETNPGLAVNLLIHIGNAYLRQPQDGPALNAYRQALARPEVSQIPRLKAYALANIGEILRRTDQPAESERALTEALQLLEQGGDPMEKRRALALLAGLHRDRGDTDAARHLYTEALALYARTDDDRGHARALAGLGRLQLEIGDVPGSIHSLERALALSTKANDHESLWHIYWWLGQSRKRAGNLDGAADAFRKSLEFVTLRQRDLRTDEGKVAFLETTQDVFDQLISVHLDRAATHPEHYVDALTIAEQARGRALNDMMQGWGRRDRPTEWDLGLSPCGSTSQPDEQIHLQAAPGLSVSGGQAAKRGMARNSVVQMSPAAPIGPAPNAAAIPRRAYPNSAALPDNAAFPNAPALPSKDAPGPHPAARTPSKPTPLARLVFHVMTEQTAVFAVSTNGRVTGHSALITRTQLQRDVAQLRAALNVDAGARGLWRETSADVAHTDRPSAPEPLLRKLYEQLIAPIAQDLPQNGQPLALEPHGPLWLLPFAALLASDGQCFAERAPLLYSPSELLLEEVRSGEPYKRSSEATALIVGNPIVQAVKPSDDDRFRIGFLPLPGADKEAELVAQIFPTQARSLLRGADADLATVVASAPKFSILHLATHGIARAEDPLNSFVLLAPSTCGDRLSARRVLTLPLSADLVTLSACQTGLGLVTGDGMIGLSRAFLMAGARSVLVSQWSIDDDATLAIMSSFYRLYLKEGFDKARALQLAMRELRADQRYAHPRYWAPYVLVGAEH